MHSDFSVKDKAKGLGILLFCITSSLGLLIALLYGIWWTIMGFIQ